MSRRTSRVGVTTLSPTEVIAIEVPTTPSRKRKRGSGSGPSESQAAASSNTKSAPPVVIEDIEEGDVLDDALQKQREDQIASQKKAENGPTNLTHGNCSICLDDYSTLVAAKCGHVFCQECLELSLRTSEKRQGDGRKAQCPSCRKPIVRKKAKEVIQIKFIDRKKFEGQKEQQTRRKKVVLGGDVEC